MPTEVPEPTPGQISAALLELAVNQIRRDVQKIDHNVSSLATIIRDGNGQPPLMVRTALLEEKQTTQSTDIKDIKKLLTDRAEKDRAGHVQIICAVISGLLALAATIVSAIVLLNKP